jgi:dienelactone hydrolase
VPAFLVEPVRKGPRAGLVFLHWGEGNKGEFLEEAVALARAGAASVLLDAPFARPEPWKKRLVEDYRASLEQSVVDVRRAVDLLLSRSKVDPKRLAVVGHSFGCTVAALASAAEPRFKTAVLMAGLPNMAHHARTSQEPFFVHTRETMSAEELERYLQSLAPVEPDQAVARPGPSRFFQVATKDEAVPLDAAQRYVDAATEPKLFRYYEAGHALNEPARRDRFQWLRLQLGLAAPNVPMTNMLDPLVEVPAELLALPGSQVGRLRLVQPVAGMEHPRVRKDVTYAREDSREWKLDVYTADDPRVKPGASVVVLVHGLLHPALNGYARKFGPLRSMAERLSTEGFVVVVPDLGSPAVGPRPEEWFGQVDKVAGRVEQVLGYMREHAGELGINPERVGLMAFSAGVPYGLRAALRSQPSPVRCAVSYYGPLTNDFLAPGTPLRDELSARELLRKNPKIPPLLVVKAGLDRPDFNASIDAFMQEARATQAPVTLLELPEGHHAFDVLDDSEASREAVRKTVAFLGQHLMR